MKRETISYRLIIFFSVFLFISCNANILSDLFISEGFVEKLSEAADYSYQKAYWVSTTGSDVKGDGSQNNPFRDINYALDQCEGGETILIYEGTYVGEFRVESPNITLRAVENNHVIIKNGTDNEDDSMAIWLRVESSGSKLQNLEIVGGYYYGIKIETMWEWGEEDRSGASDIIIEDCVIHDTGRDCIKITPNCNNITIRRCEIYNSGVGVANIEAENAEGIDNVNGDNMLVQDCYIHDISTTGIYFKGGAQDCIIERNLIKNMGFSGILIGFDTSIDYFNLEVNPEYYESINGIVRNNVIINTVYAGIGLYSSKDAKVYNNTIINTAKTAMSPIYFGLSFQDWEPEANRPPTINPKIYNNIVYQENIDSPMIFIRYADELGGMSALIGDPKMDNNCYYTNGTLHFDDRRPDSEFYTESFSAWQTHLNCDRSSFISDPELTNEYYLIADSPCVDKASVSKYVSYDIDGKKRNEAYDIGAVEF